jgi:micrococcal nuclease
MKDVYYYKANVIRVYDGDTITVDIDLGFGLQLQKQVIRLANIDTPEIRGDERPDGIVSKDIVSDLILHKDVIIKTDKDTTGKYGRWLAEVYIDDLNVNEYLITEGYADRWV